MKKYLTIVTIFSLVGCVPFADITNAMSPKIGCAVGEGSLKNNQFVDGKGCWISCTGELPPNMAIDFTTDNCKSIKIGTATD